MSTAVIGAPEFKARSGRLVKSGPDGSLRFGLSRGYIAPDEVMDAEEFFQAQRDIELGRWRFPLDPQYVVYAYGRDAINVMNERNGSSTTHRREDVVAYLASPMVADSEMVARAYFEVHPEQKPWQDAKPGEVWALTVDGVESAFYPSKSLARHFTPVAPETGRTAVVMDSFEITDGRCIWPDLVDAEIVEDES